jgi:hypothetical protein
MAIEKEQGAEGLILRGRGNLLLDCEMGEKGFAI